MRILGVVGALGFRVWGFSGSGLRACRFRGMGGGGGRSLGVSGRA